MGFNFNTIGSLIEQNIPGGKEINKIVNGVANPFVQIGLIPVNMATSMAAGMTNMTKSLMNAGTKMVDGLAGFVSSPLFTYVVIGGLALGGIMVIQNGGRAPSPMNMARMLGK